LSTSTASSGAAIVAILNFGDGVSCPSGRGRNLRPTNNFQQQRTILSADVVTTTYNVILTVRD
jgi:hypothetical protein